MKKYKVSYETKLLENREGALTVAAESKGRAMLVAQALVHPDQRTVEPYHYFEPLVIVPKGEGMFEVSYKTKIEREVSGEIEVEASDADKALSKARLAVHQEFIPPKCFKALSITEVA